MVVVAKGVEGAAVAKGAARVVEVTAAARAAVGWEVAMGAVAKGGARAAVVKAVVTEVVDTAAGARVVAVTEAEADRAVVRPLFPPSLLKRTPARLDRIVLVGFRTVRGGAWLSTVARRVVLVRHFGPDQRCCGAAAAWARSQGGLLATWRYGDYQRAA